MNCRYMGQLAFLAVLAAPNVAWSQIVYSPAASGTSVAVPTMTTAALLLLIALLVVVARWKGFDRKGTTGKIVGVLAVCAVATGTVSVKMVSDAYADGSGGGGTQFGSLDSASGGSVPIIDNALNIFENNTGVDQRIESITLGACPDEDRGLIDGVARCEVDAVIATTEDGLCYTDCRDIL